MRDLSRTPAPSCSMDGARSNKGADFKNGEKGEKIRSYNNKFVNYTISTGIDKFSAGLFKSQKTKSRATLGKLCNFR